MANGGSWPTMFTLVDMSQCQLTRKAYLIEL